MNKFRASIFLIIAAAISLAHAENPTSHPSIVEHITADSVNQIIQPEALADRLLFDENAPADKGEGRNVKGKIGYRVQIFSDNNTRTAKNEARAKERQIMSRFPQYRSYVLFKAPYWRLRVGDFRSQSEAREAAEEIRRAFPSFSKEIRVVQDRIN